MSNSEASTPGNGARSRAGGDEEEDTSRTSSDRYTSFAGTASDKIREGMLFKERDHFRGWRSRYFVLDRNFLHYYLHKEDPTPRHSLQLSRGVVISSDCEVATSKAGVEYFIFYISHPRTSTSYRLSSHSMDDATSWTRALREAISRVGEIQYLSPVKDSQRLLPRSKVAQPVPPHITTTAVSENDVEKEHADTRKADEEFERGNPKVPLHRSRVYENIPEHCIAKIEAAAETLLKSASPTAEGWLPMFEKAGVVATRKAGTGGAICVRGEALLPYTIPEIYSVVSTAEGRKAIDSQLGIYKILKTFSPHTEVEYLQFKPVWPTTARDLCNIVNWQLLRDGTFLTFGFSEPFLDICPENSSCVRADLILGGYVMFPVVGGTQVFIVVQTDLCGSIPSRVASLAAEQQPLSLIKLRTVLDKKYKRTDRPDLSVPQIAKYQDIIDIFEAGSSTLPKSKQQPHSAGGLVEDTSGGSVQRMAETIRGIPAKFLPKLEECLETLLRNASPTAEGWLPMFEKAGVVATRKTGTGGAICVRGEALLPYTIPEIYSVVSTAEGRKALDSQLDRYSRVKWFSRHAGVEYLRFKPVWPTAARDFCNLTHWRLLHDGTFVTFGTSEAFPELCPVESGLVRANLVLGGYVMRPVSGGTQIYIYVQTDLGGIIPSGIAAKAAESQPLVLATLRKVLNGIHKSSPRPDFSEPLLATYEDIISVTRKNTDAPYPDEHAKEPISASIMSNSRGADPVNESSRDVVADAPSGNNNILTLISAIFLSTPFVLFWSVSFPYCWAVLGVSMLLAVDRVVGRHLGKPSQELSGPYTGCQFFKFMVPSGPKSENFTSVFVKAISRALVESPLVHGHVVNEYFYHSNTSGVNLLIPSERPTMITISSAERRSLEDIQSEIRRQTDLANRKGGGVSLLHSVAPFLSSSLASFFLSICSKYRMSLLFFGKSLPTGTVNIIDHSSLPTSESAHFEDGTIESWFVGDARISPAPISVTVGKPRRGKQPKSHLASGALSSKRPHNQPPMEFSVVISVDSRVGSVSEWGKFIEKIKHSIASLQQAPGDVI